MHYSGTDVPRPNDTVKLNNTEIKNKGSLWSSHVNKQTKLVFTYSVTQRNALYLFLRSPNSKVHFLPHSTFAKYFTSCIVDISVCWFAVFFPAFAGTLVCILAH